MRLVRKRNDSGVVERYNTGCSDPSQWKLGVQIGDHKFFCNEKKEMTGAKWFGKLKKVVMKSVAVDEAAHSGKSWFLSSNKEYQVER